MSSTNGEHETVQQLRTGTEPLRDGKIALGPRLLDFWRWSASDLVSNATRGVFAEYIVGLALEALMEGAREEWAPFDLTTPEGITVEVKSAAYVQSWTQRRPSPISFRISLTRAWDKEQGAYGHDSRRQANVYVFALLDHHDKQTIDPLDVSQWCFFVVSSSTLDAHVSGQRSISLARLKRLAGDRVTFNGLREAVRAAHQD
jgi:hypothetical protein